MRPFPSRRPSGASLLPLLSSPAAHPYCRCLRLCLCSRIFLEPLAQRATFPRSRKAKRPFPSRRPSGASLLLLFSSPAAPPSCPRPRFRPRASLSLLNFPENRSPRRHFPHHPPTLQIARRPRNTTNVRPPVCKCRFHKKTMAFRKNRHAPLHLPRIKIPRPRLPRALLPRRHRRIRPSRARRSPAGRPPRRSRILQLHPQLRSRPHVRHRHLR
jgi:hypothetical protein